MEDSKQNWKSVWDYFLFAAIIIVVGLIVYTNLFHYCYKMNSDIASEAILARLIWESGEWMPESWFPGSELRLFQAPNLAALFYGLTHSMSLAMGISCVAMTLCIVLSAYFFISQLSFDRPQKLAFVLLCLVVPNHFVILELAYLFASYYAIHIIIMFYTLGVYIRLVSGKRKNILFIFTTIISAVLMGVLSVREILILYLPLFSADVLRQLYLIYKGSWKDKKNIFVFGWCILLNAAGYIGTRIPTIAGQGISRNIRKGPMKLFQSVFPSVWECLGFMYVDTVGKAVLFVILIYVIISIILCGRKLILRQADENTVWAYLMLLISPVLSILAVAFTTIETSERYYFVLVYTISFSLVYLIKEVKMKSYIFQGIIYVTILLMFFLQIKTIYFPIIQSEDPFRDNKYEVVKFLEENGIQAAYASFEIANSMTALSDGDVRIAAVASVERMDVNRCLSSLDWYVPNVPYESRTAYIIMEWEKDTFEKFYELHREDIQFDIQIGPFWVYESDYNFSCLQ